MIHQGPVSSRLLPDATYVKLPMADGGEGTVQSWWAPPAAHPASGGDRPLGNRCRASSILLGMAAGRHQMAAASGLVEPEAAQSPPPRALAPRAHPGGAGDGVTPPSSASAASAATTAAPA